MMAMHTTNAVDQRIALNQLRLAQAIRATARMQPGLAISGDDSLAVYPEHKTLGTRHTPIKRAKREQIAQRRAYLVGQRL